MFLTSYLTYTFNNKPNSLVDLTRQHKHFCVFFHPNLVETRVVNLGPVYTIPGSGFPGILDL